MTAFSKNRRRILSLWLPHLPIDRIKRKLRQGSVAPAKAFSSEVGTGSREENASSQNAFSSEVGTGSREENASNDLAKDSSHGTGGRLSPPLRGRVGEGGTANSGTCGSPPTLTLPHKGGGNDIAGDPPSIVVAKENNALQIFALDHAAARLGLAVGTPLATARAICPELKIFEADEAADAATLNDIADWCDRFTPLVALDFPHGLFLDITGCGHLFGGEAALMHMVCGALTMQGFEVSAAIASTSVCARTMTRHVHGRIVGDGEEGNAIAPLPVSALGADEAITRGLRRAGLKTVGDVASRTRHEITARFGADFTTLLERALGQGDAPISPRKPLPDYIVEKRFADPVTTFSVIATNLSRLAATLVKSMAQQGKGARRLEASFFRTDGVVRTIAVDTAQPATKADVIERLFCERLDALSDPLDPGFGFDLIRLSASRTEITVQQQHDLDPNVHDNDALAGLIDRIAARIGGRRVVVHVPQDTHIPERAVLAAPAQHHLATAMQAAWPARVAGEPPLRPLRLFERPEAIQVIAQVPDGPPARFVWRRATHAVVRAEGPERIAMEWWRAEGETPTRDYFRVEDESGLRFWLYRDGLYERDNMRDGEVVQPHWFMHGLFA